MAKRGKPAQLTKRTAASVPRRPWWPHLVGLLLTVLLAGVAAAFCYRVGPFQPAPIPDAAWKSFEIPDARARLEGPGDFFEREAGMHGPATLHARRFTAIYPNINPGIVDPVDQFRVADDATFLITYFDHENADFETIYRQERRLCRRLCEG